MELKWEEPGKPSRGGSKGKWSPIVDELKKHSTGWAVIAVDCSRSLGSHLKKSFLGVETTGRGGKDERVAKLYARWVGVAVTRNRQSAKKAGTWLESLARDYLIQHLGDERIDRTPKHGGKDIGDVGGVYTRDGRKVAIECKNVVKTDLSGWVRESQTERINYGAEAGIVVHKKSGTRVPGEQYVTMTLDDLIVLLGSPRPVKE